MGNLALVVEDEEAELIESVRSHKGVDYATELADRIHSSIFRRTVLRLLALAHT